MASGRFQQSVEKASRSAGGITQRLGLTHGGGSKAESTQRLQIGLFGLGSMVLLIGLATIIGNQANLTQESAVPQAAPTTEPSEATQQRDPLADAGIVPLPVETPTGTAEGSVVEDLPDTAVEDTAPLEEAGAP
ncbi:hypothetical protein INR77_05570 [Erythrobacter sp. SCSIO 43205]|uniref:hypothetical protein n=1 Tax=Erythrobacter sp. SCSIO 43205 TaxID=2779361 RepID=UPI001CA94BCE|nr:hypothetical protein [Erythrobacter sp. SCSIO 43205]UAB79153.1 hypothetical protein INR77_05570 [Erythrobacter sp. SCSIO 43205]